MSYGYRICEDVILKAKLISDVVVSFNANHVGGCLVICLGTMGCANVLGLHNWIGADGICCLHVWKRHPRLKGMKDMLPSR